MFIEELTRFTYSTVLAISQIAVGRRDRADFEEWRMEIWETLLQNALSHLGLADENWPGTSTYDDADVYPGSSSWWSPSSWRWLDLKELLWDVGRMVESLVTCLTLLVPCAFLVTFLLIVGTGYVVYLAAMELVDMYHLGRAYISLLSSWISYVYSDVRKSALDYQLSLIPFQRSSTSEGSYYHQQDHDQDHLIPPYNPDEPSPPTTPEGIHVLLFRAELAIVASVFDWRRRHAQFCEEFSLPASRFWSSRPRSGAHSSGVNCRSSSPSSSSPSPSTSTQLTTPVPAAPRAIPTAISASNAQQLSSSTQSPSVGVLVVPGACITPSPAPAPTTSTPSIQAGAVVAPKLSPTSSLSTSTAGMPTTPRPTDKTSLGAPAPTTPAPALQPIPPKSPLLPPSVASTPTATTTSGAVRAAMKPTAPVNKRVRRIIHFVSRPAPQGTPIQTTAVPPTLAPRTSTSSTPNASFPKPLENTIPQTVRQVQKLDNKPITEALAAAGGGAN
ncbi:hypothetical protein Pelo_2372 [Pelomyxa schiedti]|nr:hypothetical protein Pelo_2372 [Pelomyxa schiedti]